MGMARAGRAWVPVACMVMLLLGGCETRSISNSGYVAPSRYAYGNANGGNPFYRGELTEFDVLGIDLNRPTRDEDITRETSAYHKIALRKGDAVMVIQSGAQIPDNAMVEALERYFTVIPFTGVPLAPDRAAASPDHAANYARALRLAAARGGADAVLCYWGVLESTIEREPTKAVSWVPVLGSVVPDETQNMRIRIKVAVIDTKTGSWSMYAPKAYEDSTLSASLNRANADQGQVALLKQAAYQAAANGFVAKYAN